MRLIDEAEENISIHAPRVRCDLRLKERKLKIFNFNPRTSCEVRHIVYSQFYIDKIFQSTHLV